MLNVTDRVATFELCGGGVMQYCCSLRGIRFSVRKQRCKLCSGMDQVVPAKNILSFAASDSVDNDNHCDHFNKDFDEHF